MTDALESSLAEFERSLRRSGAPVVAAFREGIDEATVERALASVGLSPTAELVTWFAWHDGAGGDSESLDARELLPGAYHYDLRMLCREYLATRQDFDEVEASVPDPAFTSADLWDPSWFPLLRLEAGYVAVDVGGPDKTVSPVHVVWFDSEIDSRRRPLWSSLNEFVEQMARRFETGAYSVGHDGRLEGPDLDK